MKYGKKWLHICLAAMMVVLCLSAMPVETEAATVASGTTGEVTWSLDNNGLLVFSGSGYMDNYHYITPAAPWAQYRDQIKKVLISEEGPWNIGSAAFADCENLKEVEIRSNVTEIGFGAFRGCNMESISLPDSVQQIGAAAFQLCKNLKSIQLPSGLTEISSQMFNGCDELQKITIPQTVTKIGENAFNSCRHLKEIELPDSITEIGMGAFLSTAVTEITIPNAITEIPNRMFHNCKKLRTVSIPNGVTKIGEYAFGDCVSLESVRIPDTVKLIEEGAFTFCAKLTKVQVPEGVVEIKNNAFANCAKLKEVILPNSLEHIGRMAFTGTKLTEIAFGRNLKSIGELAFMESFSLKKFSISEANETYCVNGGVLYTKDMKELVMAPPGLGRVIIPDGVTTIQTYAFGNNKNKYVCIPASITKIAERAFYCVFLEEMCYLGTEQQWEQISIDQSNREFLDLQNHESKVPCAADSVCKNCGQPAPGNESHVIETVSNVKPTCTQSGHWPYFQCTVCGARFGNKAGTKPYSEAEIFIPPRGHVLTFVPPVESTAEATGNIAYWTCDCGIWFSDEQGTVQITDKQSVILEKAAMVQIEEAVVNDAIANAENSHVVKIPTVSEETKEEVASVHIPVTAIELVVNADKALSIETTQATVIFDRAAQESIVAATTNEDKVTIKVVQVKKEQLNQKQQESVKEKDVQLVISAQILCNENKISDFKGGKATVHIPFEVPKGEKGSSYKVIFIADDGTVEELETAYENGNLVVELAHFSEYAVVKAAAEAAAGTSGGWILWAGIGAAVVAVIAVVVMICKRKIAVSK